MFTSSLLVISKAAIFIKFDSLEFGKYLISVHFQIDIFIRNGSVSVGRDYLVGLGFQIINIRIHVCDKIKNGIYFSGGNIVSFNFHFSKFLNVCSVADIKKLLL